MPQKWVDGHPKDWVDGRIVDEKRIHQVNLARFLEVDLDTASTMLSLAETERDIDAPASHRALGKAHTALRAVRRFLLKIEDPDTAERIRAKADAVEAALKKASPDSA
jgi:hypothetical protein